MGTNRIGFPAGQGRGAGAQVPAVGGLGTSTGRNQWADTVQVPLLVLPRHQYNYIQPVTTPRARRAAVGSLAGSNLELC